MGICRGCGATIGSGLRDFCPECGAFQWADQVPTPSGTMPQEHGGQPLANLTSATVAPSAQQGGPRVQRIPTRLRSPGAAVRPGWRPGVGEAGAVTDPGLLTVRDADPDMAQDVGGGSRRDGCCWHCTRPVAPAARFCACGSVLVTLVDAAGRRSAAGSRRPRLPMTVHGFQVAIRAAAAGRPLFDRPLSSGVLVFRVIVMVAVVMAVAGQATDVGSRIRGELLTLVASVVSGLVTLH